MKATGIVRRIDELGRIVIPKEIRLTMRIRAGDPIEIYTENDDMLIFKKCSPIGELSLFFSQYSEVLFKTTGYPVLIADREFVVASYGILKKDVNEYRITEEVYNILEQRRPYVAISTKSCLYAAEELDRAVALIVPILVAGDIAGAVILLQPKIPVVPGDTEIKLASVAATFLAKQME